MQNILDKTSYHAVYDASILDALRYAAENGFRGVQVAVETPHLAFHRLAPAGCDAIAAFCADNKLYLTLHGPDHAATLLQTDPRLRDGIRAYFAALFDFAGLIGARLITFHPGAAARFGTDTVPRRSVPEEDIAHYRRTLRENLDWLTDTAAGRFVLCMENYRLEPFILDTLQPFLDAGQLHLCWDLAKTYRADGSLDETLEQYFCQNLARVRQVHLHDLRDGLSHCVIGTGRLDFARFLPRLARADILDYCIEVRPRDKALESLHRLRAMLNPGP